MYVCIYGNYFQKSVKALYIKMGKKLAKLARCKLILENNAPIKRNS